ncbi:hypothetical protein D3C84_728560 [compost metagenome]
MLGTQAVAKAVVDLFVVGNGTGGAGVVMAHAAAQAPTTIQREAGAEVQGVVVVAIVASEGFFHRRRERYTVVAVAPGQEQPLAAVVLVISGLRVTQIEAAQGVAGPAQAGAELVAVAGDELIVVAVGVVEQFAVAAAAVVAGHQAAPLFVQLPVELAAQLRTLLIKAAGVCADGKDFSADPWRERRAEAGAQAAIALGEDQAAAQA